MNCEWISVKERLPEVSESEDWSDDVLIVMRRFDNPRERKGEYYEAFVGYYSPEEGWWTMMHNNCHQVGVEKAPPYPCDGRARRTTDEVTHWMPLPELPSRRRPRE